MATLADSFLHDLEELEEDEEEVEEVVGATIRVGGDDDDDEEIPDAVALYEQAEEEPVVSTLSKEGAFVKTMEEIRRLTEVTQTMVRDEGEASKTPEFRLIEEANQMVGKLDVEILNIYSFIRDIYSKKFPELESIVFAPLEYIASVQRIKNETDLTVVDLSDILPSSITMAVTVASSMTTGQPLPPVELEKVLRAAAEAMHLADCRKDVLIFLESRMGVLAPNVTAIIGAAVTARLVTHAGGLTALARMPAQNIMVIGATGTSVSMKKTGVIHNSDLVQNAPPAVRGRALKLVTGKVSLAARVDSFRESPGGDVGRSLREQILRALLKAQEPPPAPLKKSLPVPDEGPTKRRGGKRYRRMKEKYGLTEVAKQANRLVFGPEAEDEVGQEAEGAGFGMLGKGLGHGRLRLQAKQQKIQVRQQKQQQQKNPGLLASSSRPSSGATGGMSSSLIFTPLQGIELTNPDATATTTGALTAASPTRGIDYFA